MRVYALCQTAWIRGTSAKDNERDPELVEEPIYSSGTRRRDEALFNRDRHAWCADRCLATGYCDVLEDIYQMSTTEVQKFCEKCAGDDECELGYA